MNLRQDSWLPLVHNQNYSRNLQSVLPLLLQWRTFEWDQVVQSSLPLTIIAVISTTLRPPGVEMTFLTLTLGERSPHGRWGCPQLLLHRPPIPMPFSIPTFQLETEFNNDIKLGPWGPSFTICSRKLYVCNNTIYLSVLCGYNESSG